MTYTVGNEKHYDEKLAGKNAHKFFKLGRIDSYPGGFAVKTIEDGYRLIDEWGKVGEWAVYEVDAVWEEDTKPSIQGWWNALQRDALILRKVEIKRQELIVRHEAAEETQRLLREPSKTYSKELAYDMEVAFDDGIRMAIQVCPGGFDPTVVEGEGGESHWTQAVLYAEDGTELGCTEPGEEFLGEYTIEATRVGEKVRILYKCEVKQETMWPEGWNVTGYPVHDLVIVAPMAQSKQVLDWVYNRGGRTTRSGPASAGDFPRMDGALFEAHAQIPLGNVDITYHKLVCVVCGADFLLPEATGFHAACSDSCRRQVLEGGIV